MDAAAEVTFDFDPTKPHSVPCDGCTLCCRRTLVPMIEEAGDNPDDYATRDSPFGPVLLQREDGACWYLGENGCTIYDRRPAICKSYSCVGQYLIVSRAERRRRLKAGLYDPAVMERARELIAKHGFTRENAL